MSCNDLFRVDATLVANEFLDKYMPAANGEYVKIYLYLLRNKSEAVSVEDIADRLELTEGDVRRAIRYWEKCGIVAGVGSCSEEAEGGQAAVSETHENEGSGQSASAEPTPNKKTGRSVGEDTMERLGQDVEFQQLLFIVQKYMSKILNEQDVQVLAYLYDGLHMPIDVLDYLVQYCVETDHSNMRYIEKTGLDWADKGIKTVTQAQQRTKQFDRIKEERKNRAAVRKSKNGMSGDDRDLDSWLNRVVQRNIQ